MVAGGTPAAIFKKNKGMTPYFIIELIILSIAIIRLDFDFDIKRNEKANTQSKDFNAKSKVGFALCDKEKDFG